MKCDTEGLLVPQVLITSTLYIPAMCGGTCAVMEASLLTLKNAAAVSPNVTPLAPVKFAPVMVTMLPPDVESTLGVGSELTMGGTVQSVEVPLSKGVVPPPGAMAASAGEIIRSRTEKKF